MGSGRGVRAGPGHGFRAGVVTGVLATVGLAGILAAAITLFQPAGADAASRAQLAAFQARAEQAQADVQALRGQLAASDADLAVERAARRALEDNLAVLQAQAGHLRDRLAFYDQLFPAGPAGTVSIRAVEIARVPAGLRYRVLLMRSARPGLAPFVGSLRFVATGMRDGVEVHVPLAPLQTEPALDAATAPRATDAPPTDAGKTVTGAQPRDAGKTATEAQPRDAGKTVTEAQSGGAGNTVTETPPGPTTLVPLEVDQYRSSEGILAVPPDFSPTEVAVEVVRDGAVQVTQQAAVAF